MNAGMAVEMKLQREKVPESLNEDFITVTLQLKRSSIGRIRIDDVLVDAIDLKVKDGEIFHGDVHQVRDALITKERHICGDEIGPCPKNGVYLPPEDATQFSYLVKVKRDIPILIDSTILASRTGQIWGRPQWRASAIALPIIDDH